MPPTPHWRCLATQLFHGPQDATSKCSPNWCQPFLGHLLGEMLLPTDLGWETGV